MQSTFKSIEFQEKSFKFCVIYFIKNILKINREILGFSGSSAGEEPAYNAGDPSSIPGSGRSPGEGIGYPQYSWTFLVAQMVKNLLVMQEIKVQSLGWEDPLEEGLATHINILAWRIPMDTGT